MSDEGSPCRQGPTAKAVPPINNEQRRSSRLGEGAFLFIGEERDYYDKRNTGSY